LRYPIKTHTLSFPEWDGNAMYYLDCLADYEEIATRASQLLRPFDPVAEVENVPYCLVKPNIRKQGSLLSIQYLDGAEKRELSRYPGNFLPEICQEKRCRFLHVCPGFDSKYIATRGWGGIQEKMRLCLEGERNLQSS
jgi:hypothetical protein